MTEVEGIFWGIILIMIFTLFFGIITLVALTSQFTEIKKIKKRLPKRKK